MKKKAVFFDRDGTLNVDIHYLHRPEDLIFIANAPQFLHACMLAGYLVIVVTNQAGIARGYYTEDDMHALHRYMQKELKAFGAHIDAFYFCPHHPEYGVGPYRVECECRKPKSGMLLSAIADLDIDISQSLLFGDKPWDIQCGESAGVKSYMVDSDIGFTNTHFALIGQCLSDFV